MKIAKVGPSVTLFTKSQYCIYLMICCRGGGRGAASSSRFALFPSWNIIDTKGGGRGRMDVVVSIDKMGGKNERSRKGSKQGGGGMGDMGHRSQINLFFMWVVPT